ncbi:MAG: hypothetical protein EON60_02480 [Alphaproteobacteria bacterium]|nr:MAG: hypothetical protein EON60_02480 [Alphaproteobacteria bacterium]
MSEQANELLTKLKGWFEGAVNSKAYTAWREEAKTSWDFYDGTQWSAVDVEKLAEHGQGAVVINKIAPKIDNLAGTEVAGRTRIAYRSRSGDLQEELAARVLSDLALYVAERSDQALEVSGVFRSGLVGGIGWLDIGLEESSAGVTVFARAEDEFAVVWDPLSRRPDYSDARFVARERWMTRTEVEMLFGDKAKAVETLAAGDFGVRGTAPYALGRGARGEEVGYYDAQREVYRIVEVQYREPAKQWRLRLADGRLVSTFDKAKLRLRGAVVEEIVTVPRVHVAYFAGDVLLDSKPLAYEHNSFTLVPFVYKRHRSDGRPYGLVRAAIDPQRELNKRRSKAMHMLNTAQVIADIDAVEDPNTLAREAARPDGIILKRAGKDLRILRNTDLAVGQVQVMEQAARDIQDVIGVYDEAIGKPSNATSGVAIQQRQMAGQLNQMFAFDMLRLLKKQLGLQVLALVRQYFTEEMVIKITDTLGAGRVIKLNQPVIGLDGKVQRGADGKPVVMPDLNNGQFDVVVEEVKDVLSARELEAAQLEMLMKAGVPVPPEVLVEASGVSAKEKILAGLLNANVGAD